MPISSSLISSLKGSEYFYQRSPRHASFNFNQESRALYRNQPRFPFEYYININLNNVDTAKTFIDGFFNSADLAQIMPLVKLVDMPSMKIESTPLNQYNRKRISQTKIAFEPIKMVFHDVADGKTLQFWEMYYRYYFADGNEPGKNHAKANRQVGSSNYTPLSPPTSTNTNGNKSAIQNIISDTLDNHNFGFNLPTVQNIRNLIQTIEIYQIHGGRFNQVTLVNPRISAFTHDVLNYSASDKTLEITFMFEYEYAYYTIQNMKLGAGESNNDSTIEQFTHGEFLEISNLSFSQVDPDYIQTNPLTQASDPNAALVGNNIQTDLSTVTNPYGLPAAAGTVGSSSLSGLIDISPPPSVQISPTIATRPFASTAASLTPMYPDMNRANGV